MTQKTTKIISTVIGQHPGKFLMSFQLSWLSLILPFLIIVGSLFGCNLMAKYQAMDTTGTSTRAILATQFQQVSSITDDATTSTAVIEVSGATPQPTQTLVSPAATNTLQVPVIVPNNQERQINFLPGGTSAYYQESIGSGEPHVYTLRAAEGQTMILTATSENHDVFLDVKGLEDGSHLVETADAVDTWEGTLPSSQDYQITITTTNPATYYFLDVELPAIIQFETGVDSVVVDGHIEVHRELYPDLYSHVCYLVYASAGQTMTVNLTSPNLASLSIGIYGQSDKQVYKRWEVKGTSGELILPATQGYYFEVYSTVEEPIDFKLEISLK